MKESTTERLYEENKIKKIKKKEDPYHSHTLKMAFHKDLRP
jgi:hypothetical protein